MARKRTAFIVGNWKMNKGIEETALFLKELINSVDKTPSLKDREIGVAPVFTSIFKAREGLTSSSDGIKLCSQNVHWDDSGQFTGEISAPMLKELGVEYAIIGHSERRKFFGESNESVNRRVKGSIKNNLKVIMCVGETREEREAGNMQNIVTGHVVNGLEGISRQDVLKYVTIAYEPVWAIGTGLNATVEQAVEVHKLIRKILDDTYGKGTSDGVRILYGGSVKPDNIDGFMSNEDIDGVLVGGASLKTDSFLRIADFKEV
ncbi:MAG: triose-phosphate isomerase [Oligoflexia bacterium]|nr:triose-phosphate isomerase [Oligoflexia bacterium]